MKLNLEDLQKIQQSEEEIQMLINDFSILEVFKNYYHKLPDSTPIELRWRALDPFPKRCSIASILDDLSLFLQLNEQSLKENDVQCINQMITDFTFAFNLTSSETFEEYAARIFIKLQILSGKTCFPSRSIFIGGGFLNHTIMYQIKKNNSETFDFSLINTGAGSTVITKCTEEKQTRKSLDVVYTGLTLEELSKAFFISLKQKESSTSIDGLIKFLDNNLLKQSAKKICSHERMLQKRGTCATKAILELLKTEFGKELFRHFYLFMNERSLKSVEEAAKTITPTALKLLFPTSPDEIVTADYYSDQLSLLIEAGSVALGSKRIKYAH